MHEFDSCRERGGGPDEVDGDAGDAGAGDRKGAEGEGRTLWGSARGEAEDWVSVGVIREEWLLRGPGRLGIGRGAETGCEGASLPRGRHQKLERVSVTVTVRKNLTFLCMVEACTDDRRP